MADLHVSSAGVSVDEMVYHADQRAGERIVGHVHRSELSEHWASGQQHGTGLPARSWLAGWVRAFIADRRTSRMVRIISTVPAVLGMPSAMLAGTDREAVSASIGPASSRRRLLAVGAL
jgi:hypothetical protein